MDYKRLSKTVSYFLRHNPWQIELEPDEAGWVPVDHLLAGIKSNFPQVTTADLEMVIQISDKTRFEILGKKIRATYGHSIPRKIKKTPTEPPTVLYHGTTTKAVNSIMEVGLLPMDRQYVHLSLDIKTAKVIASRKGQKVAVIVVDAKSAFQDDTKFYEELKGIWLADAIPSEYLNASFS